MKKIALLFAVLLPLMVLAGGDTPQEKYIAKYSAIAVSEMQRSGVPASITLAQGLLESRYGQSRLAAQGNNHFGIKCHNWKGRKMYEDDDAKGECFRVYRSAEESFRDHSDFLRYQDRYKGLFELDPADYKGWARGLKKAGYATDPKYADKLIRIIEDYSLQRFDGGVVVMAETPLEIEEKTVETVPPASGETYSFSLERPLYKRNGVRFVEAEDGETFESIAMNYGLFPKEILRFNDLGSPHPLKAGETVYIQAKKKYAARGLDKYVFAEGETLHDVCQRFAVKEKSIVKLNRLPAGYVPEEGDEILLRK